MADSSPSSGRAQWSGEDDQEAPPRSWRLMRSVALASLVPFVLLSLGHYFSVTLLVVGFTVRRAHLRRQRGEYFWVFEDAGKNVEVLVCTEVAVAAVSFAILCLSQAVAMSASAAVNLGQPLTMRELFSKVGRLWREPSITRTYCTVLLLGYVLSQILAVVVLLIMISGGEVSRRVLQLLLCALALLLCVYIGVVGSVFAGRFLREEVERGAMEALCGTVALMEEGKLQGFVVFFLSLVVTHGFLVNNGLWNDHLYRVNVGGALLLSPGPILMNAIWMVGAGGLFGYAGVLLQI